MRDVMLLGTVFNHNTEGFLSLTNYGACVFESVTVRSRCRCGGAVGRKVDFSSFLYPGEARIKASDMCCTLPSPLPWTRCYPVGPAMRPNLEQPSGKAKTGISNEIRCTGLCCWTVVTVKV